MTTEQPPRPGGSGAQPLPPAASILVADDEEEVRGLLSACLQASGYRVVEAADGEAALRLVEREQVDLVVTDVFMPNVDGLEVIRTIRRGSRRMPVIAISGGGDERALSFLSIARLLGADAVISKPFPLDELRRQVLDLLPLP